MTIAARLDRLRGRAAGHAVDSDSLAQRLEALRGRRGAMNGAPRSLVAHVADAEEIAPGLLLRRSRHRLPAAADAPDGLSALPEVKAGGDADWVYLDTETTGLSGGVGNLAFMVGMARLSAENELEVRQYLMAGFAAEPAMLKQVHDWLGDAGVPVSYNGKCFDVPVLEARGCLHRLDGRLARRPHLDLMYTVRRAYRRHWPDCRLQTAERCLLGVRRVDDLPGAEAPAAWQRWLRTGDASRLEGVLRHNAKDVVSLAELHRQLVRVYRGGWPGAVDHTAIGRAWSQAGHDANAQRVWEAAGDALDEDGRLELAALYRRQRRWSAAESIWLVLHGQGSSRAASELSKYYEHRRRDLRRAIDFAAGCAPAERAVRIDRLAAKLGRNLQLPLPS